MAEYHWVCGILRKKLRKKSLKVILNGMNLVYGTNTDGLLILKMSEDQIVEKTPNC